MGTARALLQTLKSHINFDELSPDLRKLAEDITEQGREAERTHPGLSDLFAWAESNARPLEQR